MPRLTPRSRGRMLTATVVAIVVAVVLYEVSMFYAREAARQLPVAGTRYPFTATAYCKGTTTASGVGVRAGIAASDPAVLPLGSVISITASNTKHSGVYTVMDTGPSVRGRLVDLYMWSCYEALDFGRQQIEVTVLRLGWNPSANAPSLIDAPSNLAPSDAPVAPSTPLAP